jgi:hypothetical protein
VFLAVRGWLSGDELPRIIIGLVSSAVTTGLIVWAFRAPPIERRWRPSLSVDPLLVIFAAVLIGNAVISYGYTKSEIITVAGVFYALAAFVGVRHATARARRLTSPIAQAALCLLLLTTSTLWAVRSAGVHHMLRVQAFTVRNDWGRLSEEEYARRVPDNVDGARALVHTLRHNALEMRVPQPDLLPRWTDPWWGE